MRRASRLAQAEIEADERTAPRPEAPAAPRREPPAAPHAASARDDAPGRRSSDAGDAWIGASIDGRYRVLEVIGRGGTGTVYRVQHLRIGKIAAMKVLRPELAGTPEVLARFRREAEVISRLTHPNAVQVFDFGEAPGGLYLVLEHVRGRDLGAIIDRDGPPSPARAAGLALQIAEALAEAHALGVVHRDLKPENALVTRTRRGAELVKVLDFGLATIAEGGEPGGATTQPGSILGTPYTMAPEQIRGEPVDARADLYSLGAVLYRMITGRQAFEAETPMGVLTKHLTEPLVAPSARRPDLEVDERVDAVIARAMAKSPDDRYGDIGELVSDLEVLTTRRPNAGARRPGDREPSADPGAPADDSDTRLRRADIDAFERGLRRRRRVRRTLLPLALAGAIAAGTSHALSAEERPRTEEVEPNHTIDRATPIASGEPVRGHIGRRLSETEPDRDFFRLVPEPEPGARHTARARVTALPNMDIQLAVYDAEGRIVASADEGGVGEGEEVRAEVTGPIYVLVTESRAPGELPTENVSDAYELEVTLEGAGEAD